MPFLVVDPGDTFNIIFTVNHLPMKQMLRGIQYIGDLLEKDTVRKLLFPEPEDCCLITHGPDNLPGTSLTFYDTFLNWDQKVCCHLI